jgi:hypothetical protein
MGSVSPATSKPPGMTMAQACAWSGSPPSRAASIGGYTGLCLRATAKSLTEGFDAPGTGG